MTCILLGKKTGGHVIGAELCYEASITAIIPLCLSVSHLRCFQHMLQRQIGNGKQNTQPL